MLCFIGFGEAGGMIGRFDHMPGDVGAGCSNDPRSLHRDSGRIGGQAKWVNHCTVSVGRTSMG